MTYLDSRPVPADAPAEPRRTPYSTPFVWAALVVVPLLLGGALYLGFRTERLAMFAAADRLGVGSAIDAYRHAVRPLASHLPNWVVFSLPNALWTFSMLCFIGTLWPSRDAVYAAWASVVLALSAGAELLQLPGVVPGTFSTVDLAAALIAYLAAATVLAASFRNHKRRP